MFRSSAVKLGSSVMCMHGCWPGLPESTHACPRDAVLTHLFLLPAPFSLRSESWQSGDPADPGFKFCCLCSSAGVVSAGRLSMLYHKPVPRAFLLCCAVLCLANSSERCASLQGNTADLLMCSSCQLSGFCFGYVPASRIVSCCLRQMLLVMFAAAHVVGLPLVFQEKFNRLLQLRCLRG